MAGSQVSQSGQTSEPPVLALLLDGLIDRVQRSPLMRRAPSQCTPEEQRDLSALLADLLTLRQVRAALETTPGPRLDQLQAYWPELGALLAPPRRGGSAARGRSREAAGVADGMSLFEGIQGAEPDNASAVPTGSAAPDPSPAQEAVVESTGPDLAHLLLEALTVQGRALNTTQMLAWLAEKGTQATREEVTTTLFRHEELFRKRGAGHWVVAGQDAS
ncbi:MAG: hypothetical protein ACRDG4_20820 [Chloroflexota bacterium]